MAAKKSSKNGSLKSIDSIPDQKEGYSPTIDDLDAANPPKASGLPKKEKTKEGEKKP